MQKIKQKKINNLLNYQHFLKNNSLKQKKIQLKQNLFENFIISKNQDFFSIDLNKKENYFLPKDKFNIKKKSIIYTIQTKYENHFLLNSNLNYNLLYYFTKLIFKNSIKKNNFKIKGRILNSKKKNISISFFGIIFQMKSKNLHKYRKTFFGKKFKLKKQVLRYKMKYLNFKIENHLKKSILSRKAYVQEIIEKQKQRFQEKRKKKKKNASIRSILLL